MQTLLKIRLVHSPCGRLPKQKLTVQGLGLRRLNQERLVVDTPAVRGMIKKIPHLVTIIEEGVKA